MLREISTQEAG